MAQQPNFLGITASVGQTPSVNKPEVMLRVQQLLNSKPDGRVDPGGVTWTHLVERKLKVKRATLILLPQVCGLGDYSYSAAARQYGTGPCIQTLHNIGAQFHLNLSDREIGIGDISFAQGGHMSPQESHQHGLHVDIRPLRTDKKNLPVMISDPHYSREWTKRLIQCLLVHRNVRRFFSTILRFPE